MVEAPRGTLIHHYKTDENGLISKANLIVATQNNAARMAMSVDKAAGPLITGGNVAEGILNMVEMAFRAYDPCLGCATHSLPGSMPLRVNVHNPQGEMLTTVRRDSDGSIHRSLASGYWPWATISWATMRSPFSWPSGPGVHSRRRCEVLLGLRLSSARRSARG